MDAIIRDHLRESASVKEQMALRCIGEIRAVAEALLACLRKGGKILLCGNGGSAADAQHMATELVVRLRASSERDALPALSLTTNTSLLTACGNDYGFERIFARQVEAMGQRGDILIGISTSGNSANVIAAFEEARKRGMETILFSGETGGRLKDMADLCILVPSSDTPRIQEGHITVGHILCDLVEKNYFDRISREK
jgi:D-sedoheptulose 7-phosphate isomerase